MLHVLHTLAPSRGFMLNTTVVCPGCWSVISRKIDEIFFPGMYVCKDIIYVYYA